MPPMPISTNFNSGLRTNMPSRMEATGSRLSFTPKDFVLPVNKPINISGSMETT